ncbi:MAG: GNAT family N-acetyltransferase, partial [Acetobacteraceae bacterium]|nr:GNAT family N-acetyltransferase [Acetobacteraceae bacterium]
LAEVNRIADLAHPDLLERADIPAERLRLYPAGCLVLDCNGVVFGYAVSHPWRAGKPPALDTLLGALPDRPAHYYVHDLALLPAARGTGAARAAVARLVAVAAQAGLAPISLVAVNTSAGFWQRHGFRVVGAAPASYGADAVVMRR